MNVEQVAEAALKLGVIPAIAIALVVYLFLQNRQLLRQRERAEDQMMATHRQILENYRVLLERAYRVSPEKFDESKGVEGASNHQENR